MRASRSAGAVAAALAAVALVLAACGGDEAQRAPSEAAPARTSSAVGATASGGTDGPLGAPTGTRVSRIDGLKFEPLVQVPAGTTVTWLNAEVEPHTVVAGDGSFYSGTLRQGGTYARAFPTPGRFEYFCTLHADMRGVVEVR